MRSARTKTAVSDDALDEAINQFPFEKQTFL
jgi:hypothetical protein